MPTYPIDPTQLASNFESLPPEYHQDGAPFRFANTYLHQLWVDLDTALATVAAIANQTVVDTGTAGPAYGPPAANALFPAPSGITGAPGTGGTLAAGTDFYVATYTYGNGNESGPSNEVSVTVAASGTATITVPSTPAGVTGINLYRGSASGAEGTLAASVTISGAINTLAAAVKAASLKSQNH